MTPLEITPNIEKTPWPEAANAAELMHADKIGRLPRGMTSGASSVTIRFTDAAGNHYFGQTSLALLKSAVQVFTAREQIENASKN